MKKAGAIFDTIKVKDDNMFISRGGGGVHDLWMDGGLPPGFQKGTLF